jgi:hypothetical protein
VQHIRLGLELDGERGWHPRNAVGEPTLGPLGFLDLLETQLGLTRVEVSTLERVVQWRAGLLGCRTGQRFYERSLEADQFGTAATLLRWRDTWMEHGWDGMAAAGAPLRIADMAAVEVATRGALSPCVGERLRDVAAALASRTTQIAGVELVNPRDEFSPAWRAVFARLPEVTVAAASAVACGRDGSLLHELQQRLLHIESARVREPLPWRDDGSVQLVRAQSSLGAAEWLAKELGHSEPDRLIVAEQGGSLLDAAVTALDRPAEGLGDASTFRPALQVLPLVLRLLWEPLDFTALMQLLTHPVGPLPRYARARLAERISVAPGLGGAEWRQAFTEIGEHYQERGPRVLAAAEFWLENLRFRANDKAPLEAVRERASRLADHFQNSLIDEDEARRRGALNGLQQCQSVLRSLDALVALGEERIGREALDNVVTQATGAGSVNAYLRAEAGAAAQASCPGAVIEPFDEVYWWSMRAVPLVPAHPWSAREIQSLTTNGVRLPPTATLLERQARGWCRPILAARERLTLMLPAEGEEAHPVWLTLSSLLDRPCINVVEAVMAGHEPARGVTEVPHRALPARQRWWQVPAGAIRGWDRHASYSSLQQFIYSPYEFALQYPAQLKASTLLDLPDDWTLYGNLAHRVVERLYGQADALAWPGTQVQDWFDATFDSVLREEGAVLFMAGRAADRERLRHRVRHALCVLHHHLQAAGAARVQPEQPLEADTPVGPVGGICDLLVTFKDGSRAVVDMKWSGADKRKKEMQQQAHIQLAIYARMVERNTSAWPTVAYFILNDAQMLTTTGGIFPGATSVSVAGTSTSQVWDRILVSWAWRRRQLEAGRIELVLKEVEPTADSIVPSGGLPVEPRDDRYNSFRHLAGWEPNA